MKRNDFTLTSETSKATLLNALGRAKEGTTEFFELHEQCRDAGITEPEIVEALKQAAINDLDSKRYNHYNVENQMVYTRTWGVVEKGKLYRITDMRATLREDINKDFGVQDYTCKLLLTVYDYDDVRETEHGYTVKTFPVRASISCNYAEQLKDKLVKELEDRYLDFPQPDNIALSKVCAAVLKKFAVCENPEVFCYKNSSGFIQVGFLSWFLNEKKTLDEEKNMDDLNMDLGF